MSGWKLWLDDQCHDPFAPERHAPKGFIAAASFGEAVDQVLLRGLPDMMDLDHDLGADADGTPRDAMEFLRWLEDQANSWMDELDTAFTPPPKWNIHSANPVGRDNMESFLKDWEKEPERYDAAVTS